MAGKSFNDLVNYFNPKVFKPNNFSCDRFFAAIEGLLVDSATSRNDSKQWSSLIFQMYFYYHCSIQTFLVNFGKTARLGSFLKADQPVFWLKQDSNTFPRNTCRLLCPQCHSHAALNCSSWVLRPRMPV